MEGGLWCPATAEKEAANLALTGLFVPFFFFAAALNKARACVRERVVYFTALAQAEGKAEGNRGAAVLPLVAFPVLFPVFCSRNGQPPPPPPFQREFAAMGSRSAVCKSQQTRRASNTCVPRSDPLVVPRARGSRRDFGERVTFE